MDSLMDDCSPYSQVSPFRDLRIKGYLLLPEAYRSLSRLSSALSAKASALRPSSLDLFLARIFMIRLLPACPSVGGSPLSFETLVSTFIFKAFRLSDLLLGESLFTVLKL